MKNRHGKAPVLFAEHPVFGFASENPGTAYSAGALAASSYGAFACTGVRVKLQVRSELYQLECELINH
ncbi:hypothetical protein GI364_13785 [Alicyclobacillus sp. SO9]|nr:hypothetical protein GI364_13785 [Alicyclobacillus sp. SO9]